MHRYVGQRLVHLVPVLFTVSVLVFALMHAIPGDPAQLLLGFENTDPEQLERVRREFGLDQPIYIQYGRWVGKILRGDLGTSVRTGQPITKLIGEAIPFTLELAAYALLLAIGIAVPVGVWAATTRSRLADTALQALTLFGLSLPAFWIGTMLILLFSVQLRWFPLLSYPPLWQDPLGNFRGFLLPAFTLAIPNAAAIARMVRASMLSVRGEDYVRTARGKGLHEHVVIRRHMLKNALIPIVTLIGIIAGYLLGGSIVVEQVFAIPGLGRMGLQAIVQRDYPVLQAVVLIVTTLFVLTNLLVDLLYSFLDPRVRYA